MFIVSVIYRYMVYPCFYVLTRRRHFVGMDSNMPKPFEVMERVFAAAGLAQRHCRALLL